MSLARAGLPRALRPHLSERAHCVAGGRSSAQRFFQAQLGLAQTIPSCVGSAESEQGQEVVRNQRQRALEKLGTALVLAGASELVGAGAQLLDPGQRRG